VTQLKRWMAGALLAAGLAASWPALPAAQVPSESTSEFVAVSDDQLNQEQLPAAPLVFAAYAFVWLALMAYVVAVWRRLIRIERELADVSRKIGERPS
jgi:CcmD family protein